MKGNQLLGMDQQEMSAVASAMGEKPFRGRQLYVQIYRRKAGSFAEMTDLAKPFRERLAAEFELRLPEIHRESRAGDGTVKLLLRLEDGQFVETVYIPEENRDTLCISSQVGCDVGCTFCLTARMGFRRNLTPGEIVGQVLCAIREGLVRENGFNIVFMGMGEPLYNYRNVMKAFRLLTDPDGMNLSHRKITVSTSGVVPVLRRLAAEEGSTPNLAISLNATTPEVRDRIMPINLKWTMEELLQTLREFPVEPRRRITIEYVLLKDENDSPEDAHRLASLLRGIPVKVNLIPYNPNPGLPHVRPEAERVGRFQAVLSEYSVASFVRRARGDDVSAACGQLACFESVQAVSGR